MLVTTASQAQVRQRIQYTRLDFPVILLHLEPSMLTAAPRGTLINEYRDQAIAWSSIYRSTPSELSQTSIHWGFPINGGACRTGISFFIQSCFQPGMSSLCSLSDDFLNIVLLLVLLIHAPRIQQGLSGKWGWGKTVEGLLRPFTRCCQQTAT